MALEPRIRVSALLRWQDRILLCRHEKAGRGEYWLLPGGGVNSGESLLDALHRELAEEVGLQDEISVEGPIALVDSISPEADVLVEARRPHHLRGRPLRPLARGRHVARRRGPRPPSLRAHGAGGDRRAPADPALPPPLGAGRPGRCTSARSGRPKPLRRPPRERARLDETSCARASSSSASGASSGGSPPVRCASACASSQSASHGFRGRSGPCRYVPSARPSAAALEAALAVVAEARDHAAERLRAGSSLVRPAWFSKPASVRGRPGSSSHSSSTSPIIRRSPATVSSGSSPTPGISSP